VQLMTMVFMCGMYTLIVLEVVQWVASGLKPAIGFRGVKRLAFERISCKLRPRPSDVGRVFSTNSCDCRIVAPNELVFTDRKSVLSNPWLLKGRIVTDGMTWCVETYGSVTFWVFSATLLTLWGAMSWGSYLADGIIAGSVAFAVGVLGFLIFRHWYGKQLRCTAELVDEIAYALERRNLAQTEGQST
jgi:hypothetical protein